MLKFGIISEVKKGYAKVAFLEDNFVSDFLPVMVGKSMYDKESWQLDIYEHVVCLMDEDCEIGVILGAIPNESDVPDANGGPGKFTKTFSDGSRIEFNSNTGKLIADIMGEVDLQAGGSIKAQSALDIEAIATKVKVTAPLIELIGNSTLTGNLTIMGALIASTGITTAGPIVAASIATTGGGTISSEGTIEAAEVIAGTVALSAHTHGGIQPGSGVTTPPIP